VTVMTTINSSRLKPGDWRLEVGRRALREDER